MKIAYSDEDLTAFLDGHLSADNAAEIQAAAALDPDLTQRLQGLALDSGQLRDAFEPFLQVAQTRQLGQRMDAVLSRMQGQPARRAGGLAIVASYAAAMVVGASLVWAFLKPADEDWRTEVAHYQALYVPDTLMPITPDAGQLQVEFARAGDVLGLKLEAQAFADVPGLKLRRAQILGYNGAPLVQIAFTLPDGSPFAFCILQKPGPSGAPRSDILMGLPATSWSTQSHKYLAIGGTDAAETLELAMQLQQRL